MLHLPPPSPSSYQHKIFWVYQTTHTFFDADFIFHRFRSIKLGESSGQFNECMERGIEINSKKCVVKQRSMGMLQFK